MGGPWHGSAQRDPVHGDNNGNLTDDGIFTYEFDAWSRLTEVKNREDGLSIGDYEYDAVGRRIKEAEGD